MTKHCKACDTIKSVTEFHKSGKGFHSLCKPCRSAQRKTTDERARSRDSKRLRYASDPAYRLLVSGYNRKQRYGVTPAQVSALLALQDYRCAICLSDSPGVQDWHVDHDHACCPGIKSCGSCVRGLLCNNCNRGLGMFKDDPSRLIAAISYLSGMSPSGNPQLSAGVSRMNAAAQ